MNQDPLWMRTLSRHLGWIAVRNLSVLIITLQGLGFLLILSDPVWFQRLALLPDRVLQGELWRLVTFLALPLSLSPIWMLFTLAFLYFILNSIESEWGEFKTTLYVLVSLLLTISFSLVLDYPVTQVSDFVSTLFLATAALYPEQEIRIYFFFPVKMKVLGLLALAFLALRFFQGSWMDRFFLLTIYSNYFLFFGPTVLFRFREWKRRRAYKSNFR